jgi:FAD/FMN-containing dehydrogenase
VLGEAMEAGFVADAVIAKSQAERDAMWALRDDVGQPFRNGPAFTYDISLPISEMPAYVAKVRADLTARWPKAELTVFGHLGDGNLHLVAGVGDRSAKPDIEAIVYAPLKDFAGSVSAEHGIGLQKRAYLGLSRSPAEVALMRTLKDALDPKHILNPGKIFS